MKTGGEHDRPRARHRGAAWAVLVTTVVAFVALWIPLAARVPPWSDEITHFSVAKGILETGNPVLVAFERCGALTADKYRRGVEVSWLAATALQAFGDSLWAARLVPLAFTAATWLTFVLYAALRQGASASQLAVATVLFFGQSLVLEQALNVRVYAPLMFAVLAGLVALWEAHAALAAGKRRRAALFLCGAAALVGLPTARGWHIIQVPIVMLAALLLALAWAPAVTSALERAWQTVATLPWAWRWTLAIVAAYVVVSVSVVTRLALDFLTATVLGTKRVLEKLVFDNIAGLVRLGLVLNVCLPLWWRRTAPRTFEGWLLATGIVSGVLIGLFMTHSFVFYGRYFYIPGVLAVLGASRALASVVRPRHVAAMLGCYLALNAGLSGATYALDRSNITVAIDWLRAHAASEDLILTFSADLPLNGGDDLCPRTTSILADVGPDRAAGESAGFEYMRRDHGRNRYIPASQLRALIAAHPTATIYFLFTDTYQFRDTLYERLIGQPRSRRIDLYAALRDTAVAQDVLPDLRGAGLKRLDRAKLMDTLARGVIP